jgi:hypothetical protein
MDRDNSSRPITPRELERIYEQGQRDREGTAVRSQGGARQWAAFLGLPRPLRAGSKEPKR